MQNTIAMGTKTRAARVALLLILAALPSACSAPGASPAKAGTPEAISLLGEPLYPMSMTDEQRSEREAQLATAREQLADDPNNEQAIIWVGRRLAYLGRYRDAVAIYSEGLARHPNSAHLLRHRGHRHITLRRFDDAVTDLTRASWLRDGLPDEIEPDGQPNDAGIPTSSLHANIYYHLGLAHYLNGDFEEALRAYRTCIGHAAVSNDMTVATAHWLYMTMRRMGFDEQAATLLELFSADTEIVENFAYLDLLLMYKGELTPEQVLADVEPGSIEFSSRAYGVANWYRQDGDWTTQAEELFDAIVDGEAWPAFGYLAAEAELAREQQR